jgi:hypothetical protein
LHVTLHILVTRLASGILVIISSPRSLLTAASSYMQRLIRLHRPFYIRSFQDKRYEYSRNTALYAARQIALGHRKLIKMGCKREWRPSVLSQNHGNSHLCAVTL